MARSVLIIGDSQSQGIGVRLAALLKSKGDKVTRISRPGYGTKQILQTARTLVTPSKYDLVFVFAGGNQTWGKHPSVPLKVSRAAVTGLLNYLRPAGHVVWVGPPPATKITNLTLSKKVFGGKPTSSEYWFATGTARRREQKNVIYSEIVGGSPASYYDVRDLFDVFPAQPDGIHVFNGRDKIAQDLARYPVAPSIPVLGLAAVVGVFWWARRKKQ